MRRVRRSDSAPAAASAAPIVLIHGIKGSHLAQTYDDSFDVIWSGAQHRFESVLDLALDDAGTVERDPRNVIAVLHIERAVYGELLGRLRQQFSDAPVYIFRYDWRRDLAEVAAQLDRFLATLSAKTGASAFRFVTHSAGALVLAAFLGLDPHANLARVERAVLAAPPFSGAVEAVRTLIIGDAVRFGINTSNAYRKIARTFPSVYQLIPGYADAWRHPDKTADIWDLRSWQARVRFDTRDRRPYRERTALMQRHLARASEFHARDLIGFDALPRTQRHKFLVLYGTGEQTRVKILVRKHNTQRDVRHFFDFDARVCWTGDGDGTVPAASARRFSGLPTIAVDLSYVSAWWPTHWDDTAKVVVAGYHAMFLALDKIQGLVIDWLAGRNPKTSWVEPIRP